MTQAMPTGSGQNASALTDEAFWDSFWSDVKLPAIADENVRWQLSLTTVFRRFLTVDSSREVFEVGCAPGRWLVWFHRTFGYTAFGCDSSRLAAETTRANLTLCGVPGEVYTADINVESDRPSRQYDVVASIGVIEHFSDPEPVLRQHVALLKPGGTLLLNVPNLAGSLNLRLLKWARMDSLIEVHNLATMNREIFLSLSKRLNLEVCYLGYVGGFDPGLVVYNHSYKSRWKRPPVFYALWLLERITKRWPRLGIQINHPAFSSMLVGVFRRAV